MGDDVRVNMLQSGGIFGEQMGCIQVIQRELKHGCRYWYVLHYWGVLALEQYSFHSVGERSGGGCCMARIKGSAAVGGDSKISVIGMGQHVNIFVECLRHCLFPRIGELRPNQDLMTLVPRDLRNRPIGNRVFFEWLSIYWR